MKTFAAVLAAVISVLPYGDNYIKTFKASKFHNFSVCVFSVTCHLIICTSVCMYVCMYKCIVVFLPGVAQ